MSMNSDFHKFTDAPTLENARVVDEYRDNISAQAIWFAELQQAAAIILKETPKFKREEVIRGVNAGTGKVEYFWSYTTKKWNRETIRQRRDSDIIGRKVFGPFEDEEDAWEAAEGAFKDPVEFYRKREEFEQREDYQEFQAMRRAGV